MSDKREKAKGVSGFVLRLISMDLVEKFVEWILRKKLHVTFKRTIIESLVQLFLCLLAVYMAVFKHIGDKPSLWISSILFIGVLLWSVIESISKYYMLPILIIQERSVRTGIVKFVEIKYPEAESYSGVYSKVCSFLMGQSRSSGDIIWDFICSLTKDIITFISIYSLYILLVHWIFKPIILEKFAGLTTMQIYLFPIKQFL